jgi:hypothetical protein
MLNESSIMKKILSFLRFEKREKFILSYFMKHSMIRRNIDCHYIEEKFKLNKHFSSFKTINIFLSLQLNF